VIQEECVIIRYDPISTEGHELDFFLQKWGKKKTKKNRLLLYKKIQEFWSISSYSPHNRDTFSAFVKKRKIKGLLDTLNTAKNNKNSALKSKIQKKAHDIYVQRTIDAIPGNAFTDWLLAEKEIKEKHRRK